MKLSAPTHRIPTALAIAAGALLAAPAAGMASDTFGSRLLNEPANSSECPSSPCTLVSYIHPSAPNGDPYSGGAPSDGVITKFRVRAKAYTPGQPVSATLRVANISRQSPDQATASGLGSGQPTTLVANGQIEEHATRVPVKKGNHLALDASNAQLTYNASGSKFTYVFSPLLGQSPRTSNQPTGELLVQATVEPDRDHDGFGDETQDKCPSQASTAGQCDHTAPRVGSIKLGSTPAALPPQRGRQGQGLGAEAPSRPLVHGQVDPGQRREGRQQGVLPARPEGRSLPGPHVGHRRRRQPLAHLREAVPDPRLSPTSHISRVRGRPPGRPRRCWGACA